MPFGLLQSGPSSSASGSSSRRSDNMQSRYLPFGLPSSNTGSNMHPSDAEVLAAINGSASLSVSLSTRSASSSSLARSSIGPLSSRVSSCASSISGSSSVASDDSSSIGSSSSDRGRAGRSGRGGGGRGVGIIGALDGFGAAAVRARFGGMKRRERRMFLGGMASLALLAALLCLSGGGGGSPAEGLVASDARALTRGSVPPSLLHHLADLSAPDSQFDSTPLPTFWHVLKSGGTAVQDMAEDCFALRVASEVGATNGFGEEKELKIVEVNEGHTHVNVDTTTSGGIQRASKMHLAQSGMADILFTPLLVETSDSILSPQNSGRMFALFRHPVHRAVSQFYYLRGATWEPTYNPAFGDMTLQDWAFTPHVESNWMVRSLVNKMEGPLTGEDLGAAKEIIRSKCLVGLLDRMEESVDRFRSYFGFGYHPVTGNPKKEVDKCVSDQLNDKSRGNRSDHPFPIKEGDDAWLELEKKNGADMVLYKYARELFEEQRGLVESRAEERRQGKPGAQGDEGEEDQGQAEAQADADVNKEEGMEGEANTEAAEVKR